MPSFNLTYTARELTNHAQANPLKMSWSQRMFVANEDAVDFTKLFVLVELYEEGIAVNVKNIEKLNKKYGCKIDPVLVLNLYTDDCDKTTLYISNEIFKTTGKNSKNLVHIWAKANGRAREEQICWGRIALLDVSPKKISMKEPPADCKLLNALLEGYKEANQTCIIGKGKM